MRLNRLCIAITALLACAIANAQEFAVVDDKKGDNIEKATENVLNNCKVKSAEDKAWYREIIVNALDNYLKMTEVRDGIDKKQYEEKENAMKGLDKEIKSLNDSINLLNRQSNDNALRLLQFEKEQSDEYNSLLEKQGDEISQLEQTITSLQADCDALQLQINSKDNEIADLNKQAENAKPFIEQGENKQEALNRVYNEVHNAASLSKLDKDAINKVISEYEGYMKLANKKIPGEISAKINYLQSAITINNYYANVNKYFEGKYNQAENDRLIREGQRMQSARLTQTQHDELANYANALRSYSAIIDSVKKIDINILEPEGLIVDSSHAKEIKGRVIDEVRKIPNNRHMGATYFSPLYKNLNNAFDEMLNGLKEMSEIQFTKFREGFINKL